MQIEEMREAIEDYCLGHYEKFRGCGGCPLWDLPESSCFKNVDDTLLKDHYERIFGKLKAEASDPVNHADHYNAGDIECIDAIEASMSPIEYAGFLKGQVIKYLWRYRHKGKAVQDLKKAEYYHARLIAVVEKEEVAE